MSVGGRPAVPGDGRLKGRRAWRLGHGSPGPAPGPLQAGLPASGGRCLHPTREESSQSWRSGMLSGRTQPVIGQEAPCPAASSPRAGRHSPGGRSGRWAGCREATAPLGPSAATLESSPRSGRPVRLCGHPRRGRRGRSCARSEPTRGVRFAARRSVSRRTPARHSDRKSPPFASWAAY